VADLLECMKSALADPRTVERQSGRDTRWIASQPLRDYSPVRDPMKLDGPGDASVHISEDR